MPKKPKAQKTFIIQYTTIETKTSEIEADTLQEALENALSLTADELDKLTGDQQDIEIKITGVFE